MNKAPYACVDGGVQYLLGMNCIAHGRGEFHAFTLRDAACTLLLEISMCHCQRMNEVCMCTRMHIELETHGKNIASTEHGEMSMGRVEMIIPKCILK